MFQNLSPQGKGGAGLEGERPTARGSGAPKRKGEGVTGAPFSPKKMREREAGLLDLLGGERGADFLKKRFLKFFNLNFS